MRSRFFILALSLLLVLAFAIPALAQSPTTSSPGPTTTHDPYTATKDHPNPGNAFPDKNATPPTDQSQSATAPSAAAPDNSAKPPSDTMPSSATSSTPSSTLPSDTASSSASSSSDLSSDTSAKALPKTASDLPLIGALGLIALSGGLLARSLNRRRA